MAKTLKVGDRELELDEDGFLKDPSQWDKEVAEAFAREEGIELTDEHWEIVNFLREYYQQYQIAPMIRILVKEVGKKLGPEKGNLKYIYKLFPNGPAKQACKIAGLPKPTGCV
ncbi:MAG: TusE/DsrC/DsvC family sulfur relay protein [Euryarchaeota archaeon]|jgi:tRNA 2-thiouridine synthesizing protein E|nr:TusE/DsrC/DsvC family sulfur relay protein [Euryarchaeota archaeon]